MLRDLASSLRIDDELGYNLQRNQRLKIIHMLVYITGGKIRKQSLKEKINASEEQKNAVNF